MPEAAVKALNMTIDKHRLDLNSIDYFLPHLSSLYFKEVMLKALKQANLIISEEKWFTNLEKVGNIGSASIYVMLDELFKSQKLNFGQKILLCVPESARFTMSFVQLTVV